MSTWISEARARRAFACTVLLLALPGCLAFEARPQAPLTEATLGSEAVRLSAPRGHCIDRSSLRRLAGGGGFALLAPCTQLTGTRGISVSPAMMTVSVMPQGPGAPAPDAESLAAAIAPAPVGAEGQTGGLVYAQVMQGGEAVLPGGDPRHWRGTRAVGGHLASLVLYAPEGSVLAGRDGRLLLDDLAKGLTVPADTANDDTRTVSGHTAAKTPRGGLFARLFPNSN